MITLGVILLLVGIFLKISILYTIGIILLVVGVVLFILGAVGREVGGRKHYYCPGRANRPRPEQRTAPPGVYRVGLFVAGGAPGRA